MRPLRGWSDLQQVSERIARGSVDYSTNLFVTAEGFADWSRGREVAAGISGNAVVVTRSDRDFSRLYHISSDWADLGRVLAALPAGRYVCDLVGARAGLERVTQAYEDAGFQAHSLLVRMARMQGGEEPPVTLGEGSDKVSLAGEADADEIATMLERLLDPLVEQIPTLGELAAAAVLGQLLIVRRAGAIAGMLMYDLKGKLAHLQFWHVDQAARGGGLGASLMAEFLHRCAAAKRIVLWVIGTNARSVAIYRHYGFAEDGLLDRIMILHKKDNA